MPLLTGGNAWIFVSMKLIYPNYITEMWNTSVIIEVNLVLLNEIRLLRHDQHLKAHERGAVSKY